MPLIFVAASRLLFKFSGFIPGKKGLFINKNVIQYMEKNHTVRSERMSSAQQIEGALREHKKRVGETVHVTISSRTTFEFPADLSQEERERRIENYKKRHGPMV